MCNMFVVRRINRLNNVGEPIGACPIGLNRDDINNRIQNTDPIKIDWEGAIEYVINESLKKNTLRQGWGFNNPSLDLRLNLEIWISNFIVASWKYYEEKPTEDSCIFAKGRKNILDRMLLMEKNDVIFLPKTPDSNNFTVALVKKPYKFDEMKVPDNDFRNEFRHTIGIANQMTYKYSNNNLMAKIFGAPLIHAVDFVSKECGSYDLLKAFTDKYKKEIGS